jgi:hypothetical protein
MIIFFPELALGEILVLLYFFLILFFPGHLQSVLANHAADFRLQTSPVFTIDHRISFGTWIFLGRFSTVHMVDDFIFFFS